MIISKNAYDEVATTVVTKQALTEIKAPEWSRVLLGVYVKAHTVIMTADESVQAKGFIESDDVGLLPLDFLLPWGGGIDATTGGSVQPLTQYYPINARITGGETFKPYVQVLVSNTGIVVASYDLVFGQAGDKMPSYLDPHPGVQRFHKTGTRTASADDLATGTAYTIVGGDFLRKVYGCVAKTTHVHSKPASGFFRLASDGFGSSPIEYTAEGVGSCLGAATGGFGPLKVTERYMNMPITRYCNIQDYFFQLGGVAITTDYWQTAVEFSRTGPWY